MMNTFQQTLGFVAAVAVGIVGLTLFFTLLSWGARKSVSGATKFNFKGVIDEMTPVTVHIANGNPLQGVRFVGLLDSQSTKGGLPWELNGMVILEHENGRRSLLQAKEIRMIEVPPRAPA